MTPKKTAVFKGAYTISVLRDVARCVHKEQYGQRHDSQAHARQSGADRSGPAQDATQA